VDSQAAGYRAHLTPPRDSPWATAPGRRGERTRDGGPDRAFFSPRSGIHLPTRYLTAAHTAYGPRAHMILTFTMSHETGHHLQSLLHPDSCPAAVIATVDRTGLGSDLDKV
jgi:hypothetical protein